MSIAEKYQFIQLKWYLIGLLGIIATLFMFIPFMYFQLLPIICVALFIHPKTRIHAVFVLLVFLSFFLIVILSRTESSLPDSFNVFSEYNIIGGWSMFLVSYLHPFYTLGISSNLTILFPIVLLELGYMIYKHQNWTMIFASCLLLVTFSGFGIQYANSCARQFENLELLMGQTLQQEQLLQQVGEPVYFGKQKERGYYVKGQRMICVLFNNDGTCKVYENKAWFLD